MHNQMSHPSKHQEVAQLREYGKKLEKYRYRVWCDDCTGEDPEGCFDGSTHLSEETFDTWDKANNAGAGYVHDVAPWDYCVTDEDGKEIKANEEEEKA
jgi:hypothetical protein